MNVTVTDGRGEPSSSAVSRADGLRDLFSLLKKHQWLSDQLESINLPEGAPTSEDEEQKA